MKTMVRISRNGLVRAALLTMVVLAVPVVAHAQTGCTDSPENPTAVLALVGAAGACMPYLRNKLRARRSK